LWVIATWLGVILSARTESPHPRAAGDGDSEWIQLRPTVRADPIYDLVNRGLRVEAATKALALARILEGFLERHPEIRHWNEAARTQRELLLAVATVRLEGVSSLWGMALERALKRSDLTEAARYRLDLDDLHFRGSERGAVGDRDGEIRLLAEGYRKLMREYPDQSEPYERLMMMAEDAGLREADLGREFLATGKAPESVRQLAQMTLDREKLLQEPLDLKFSAVDGRRVDLVELRGKVVLVDFWSTWCGPCVAEMPGVIEVYRKYHEQGFEVVGISLDTDRVALDRFLAKHEAPWPQHYSGRGWEDPDAKRFGIRAIPTMWLLDHTGRIADRSARGEELGKKVERMLAARPGV